MSGRFEDIAEKFLDPVIRGTSEWMCRCPFCDGASSLQFNIDKGLWNCFRCDAKGNAKILVKRLGGLYSDPALSVEHIYQILDRMKISRRGSRPPRVFEESYLRRFDFGDDYWTEVRGFSNETIVEFDLGYDPILDRNTIAYRNTEGDLLGIIYRLKGDVFPRYIYPDGFDRKNSLFGSWKINTKKAALVEGSTDVMACFESGFPAVAQYGSSISQAQGRLLHRLNLKEVVLFYDYDEAGRKAEEKSREIIQGIILRAVQWNKSKYCWHERLCNCGEHDWRTIAKCKANGTSKKCKCGRKHNCDPSDLKKKERKRMYDEAVLIGSKKWHIQKSA